ncbi:MAG: Glu-tRNA(Gln) amidotransferase subunit GatE [Ignavibacteria bacterium]|nr:Glu-tRNA(Gln) amidotransferase subunit GatE [Ignavibacteria bacterium]
MENDFLKNFEEMTDADYEALGFRAGVEIHQQLETNQKLFCRCPSPKPPYDNTYHTEIVRTMRPTPSELGEIDPSILMEYKTRKEIHYRINRNNICTYELDQTPPFEINQEALDIALQFCFIFNAKPIDEIYILRKHQLDGSIPSGFQRTALIGVDGFVEFNGRNIHLSQIILEEDAAREHSDQFHIRTFYTDRLGIPLIEIVTEPELKSPNEVKEFCELIRNYFIVSGKGRVGSGTFRFDLNISITGGTRIEIKGIDKIKNVPIIAYNEVRRQWNLIRLRDELNRKGITPETFSFKSFNIYKVLKNTEYYPIAKCLANGGEVHCILFPKWAGLLKWPTQRYTVFSQEISDRVKVIACLTETPNIIVSDIIDNTISREEIDKTRKFIGASDKDAFVIVWGNSDDVKTAVDEIIVRLHEATQGIPSESRRALKDGTTAFERILPGTDRMYPDTDLPTLVLDSHKFERIRLSLSETFGQRLKWCLNNNIPKVIISKVATSRRFELIRDISKEMELSPSFVANELLSSFRWLRRKKLNTSLISNEQIKEVFKLYKSGKILKEGIKYAFELILKGQERYILHLLSPVSINEIETAFHRAILYLKNARLYHPEKTKEIAVGLIMQQLRGRVEGRFVHNYVFTNWNKKYE